MLDRAMRIETREHQQVLDKQSHASGFGFDSRHQLRRVGHRALPIELGEPFDRRQRCAEFVAGVGDESAHLVLGATSLLL